MFFEQVEQIERKEKELAWERTRIECRRQQQVELPPSIEALRHTLEEAFRNLALGSFEFGDLMRQLVSELSVYVVRLCDGGHPLSRAKVKLNLAGSLSDIDRLPELGQLLTREFTIDLSRPPQRERIREEVDPTDGGKNGPTAHRSESDGTGNATGGPKRNCLTSQDARARPDEPVPTPSRAARRLSEAASA